MGIDPVLLDSGHLVEGFDCGKQPLNDFLIRHALSSQQGNSSRTYVNVQEGCVAGYFTLAASAVLFESAPERMSKGLARHAVPVILMARYAVDVRFQGQGLGGLLVRNAMQRVLSVSREVGVRAMIVHAKDDEARERYLRIGMESFESNPYHLYLLTKDIAKLIG